MVAILIVLLVALVVVAIVFGVIQENARKEGLARLAVRLGLTLTPGKDRGLVQEHRFLDLLHTGSDRYAANVLQGAYRGHPVRAFDYHYETYRQTKDGRQTDHHYFSYFILYLPVTVPEFHLYPESFLSRIGQALGAADIDFESDEFSRAFVVKCGDKKFAYDICHPRMMEHLLRYRGLRMELEGGCMGIWFDGVMKAEEVEARLRLLVEIRDLIPQYLIDQAHAG